MVWGLPAGVLAGLAPGLAPVLHGPTRLGVRWIALVARVGAAAPLGKIGAAASLALATVAAVAVFAQRARQRWRGRSRRTPVDRTALP
jgi:hypothetical protein